VVAQLSAIVADLQAAEQRFHLLHRWLPRDVWFHSPGPGLWSPAECVAHLNLTSRAVLPLLNDGLREAAADTNRPVFEYRRDVVGWLIWKLIAPANRLRTHTPPAFMPERHEPLETVLTDFAHLQSEIMMAVRAADGLPIDRVTVQSPFDGRIRCNLYSVLTLIPRHQARHAVQAERAATMLTARPSPLAV
jgi:hypothetical protein